MLTNARAVAATAQNPRPITAAILLQIYALVRGDLTIRPPDAIQLACAAAAEVDLFITNDDRLSKKQIPRIKFITSLERAPIS